jgi:hypothetical protein
MEMISSARSKVDFPLELTIPYSVTVGNQIPGISYMEQGKTGDNAVFALYQCRWPQADKTLV